MAVKSIDPAAATVAQENNTQKNKPAKQGLAGVGSSLISSKYDLDLNIQNGKLPTHERPTVTCNSTCAGCTQTDSGCSQTQTANSTCSGC